MKAKITWAASAVLLCVATLNAELVLPRPRITGQNIGGFRLHSYVETFKPNERALVIASGEFRSCLGVYVFDAQGNCVAKDDGGAPKAADDLVTEWIPEGDARYSIEVRNAGYSANEYQIAIR